MNARFQLTLDGVGCLSLVTLTIAIHWFLAARFPDHGLMLGALLWIASMVAGTFIVGRALARSERRSEAKLAAAPCPWCGAAIGRERAAMMRARWNVETTRVLDQRLEEGSARPRRAIPRGMMWTGECAACGKGVAFDSERGNVTRHGPDLGIS